MQTIDRSVVDALNGNLARAEDIDRAIDTIVVLVASSVAAMQAYDKEAGPAMLDLKRLGQVKLRTPQFLMYAIVQQLAARLGVNVANVELADLHRNSGWLKFNETIAGATRKDLAAIQDHVGMHVATAYEQPPRTAA